MRPRPAPALALSLLAAACASPAAPPPAAAPAPSAEPVAAVPAAASHFEETAVPTLRFEPRPGWIVEEPATPSRVAQFLLPRAGGDAGDARLVVYHFGGGGGSREAVIERWIGQVEQPDGGDSAEVAEVTDSERGGLRLATVDVAGTYVAETFPGSGQRVNEPGWRLLATMVECEGGPYYVKCVGPAATVERWKESYLELLTSLR